MDKQGNTTGVCHNPPISPPPPAALDSPAQGAGTGADSGNANINGKPVELRWLFGAVLGITLLLRFN